MYENQPEKRLSMYHVILLHREMKKNSRKSLNKVKQNIGKKVEKTSECHLHDQTIVIIMVQLHILVVLRCGNDGVER